MDAKKDKEVSAKEDKEVSFKDHITIGAICERTHHITIGAKEVSVKEVQGEEHEDRESESLAVHYFFVISMAPWSSAARPGCIPLERREAVRASMYRAAVASIETLDSAAAQ